MIDQIGCGLWQKLDSTTTLSIIQMRFTLKMILNYPNQLDGVPIVMRTRYDNNMTDCIDVANAENETKPSWPTKPSTIFDKNEVSDHIGPIYIENNTE